MYKVISPFVVSARRRIRDSFTLVEILVVIAIIAILAGVALPAITGALRKAQENGAMQSARGLELGCFQYANDNNLTYPGGNNTLVFFSNLTNGYVNNTDALYINGYSGKSKYVSGTLAAANVCWDATVVSPSSGLTSADPDQTPVIMSSGSEITYPTSPSITNATASITNSVGIPFGYDGIAVAYKSGSATFAHATGPSTAFSISSTSFAPANTYVQITP